jgi:hypothetical protein
VLAERDLTEQHGQLQIDACFARSTVLQARQDFDRLIRSVRYIASATRKVTPPSWPSSPVGSRSAGIAQAPPEAVVFAARAAIEANTALRVNRPAQWVQTTTKQWDTLNGVSARAGNTAVYLVQIRGEFLCKTCKGTWTTPPRGTVMILELPIDPSAATGGGFTFGNVSYDLHKLGTPRDFNVP